MQAPEGNTPHPGLHAAPFRPHLTATVMLAALLTSSNTTTEGHQDWVQLPPTWLLPCRANHSQPHIPQPLAYVWQVLIISPTDYTAGPLRLVTPTELGPQEAFILMP